MNILRVALRLGLALGLALPVGAGAQGPAPASTAPPAAPATAKPNLDVVKGTWVRPDGGYVIDVKGVGADGRLEATYFNPNQLPFAKAQASNDGGVLRVALVIQAGGDAGRPTTFATIRQATSFWHVLPGRSQAQVRRVFRAAMTGPGAPSRG